MFSQNFQVQCFVSDGLLYGNAYSDSQVVNATFCKYGNDGSTVLEYSYRVSWLPYKQWRRREKLAHRKHYQMEVMLRRKVKAKILWKSSAQIYPLEKLSICWFLQWLTINYQFVLKVMQWAYWGAVLLGRSSIRHSLLMDTRKNYLLTVSSTIWKSVGGKNFNLKAFPRQNFYKVMRTVVYVTM